MRQAPKSYSFSEIQRFTQSWLFYLVVAISLVPIISTLFALNDSNLEQSDFLLTMIVSVAVGTLIMGLLLWTKLEVYLERDGITHRLFPFQVKFKRILYEDINSYKIRKYSPIMEYGGWGLRYSFKNGWAYNISGRMGIQLEINDNKKILFGTLKPEEFYLALNTIIKNRNQEK